MAEFSRAARRGDGPEAEVAHVAGLAVPVRARLGRRRAVDAEGPQVRRLLRSLLIGEVPEALQAFMTKNRPPNRKVTQLFPDAVDGKDATVYDFVFDKPSGKWVAWVKTREESPIPEGAQYTDIIVPTVDTIRYTFLIDVFVNARVNFLFVGPTGTGKTVPRARHPALADGRRARAGRTCS